MKRQNLPEESGGFLLLQRTKLQMKDEQQASAQTRVHPHAEKTPENTGAQELHHIIFIRTLPQ